MSAANIAASRLQLTFGDRILACYVVGSYADGTAVSRSDIDLVIVFKGQTSDGERQAAEDVCKTLSDELSTTIDLEILDEQGLKDLSDPVLKLGSDLLFGADIRDALPEVDLDDWARDRLHTSYWRSVNLFSRPTQVTLPLSYPAVDDAFFGYVISGNTRNLLRHVSWAATALIAYHGRTVVVRKADFHRVYRTVIHDSFSGYLQQLYQKCKLDWDYQIPENSGELRELCWQTLAFENQFMDVYRSFLVAELQGAPLSAQLSAVWLQVRLPLIDADVKAELIRLASHDSAELKVQAAAALEAMVTQ